MGIVDLFGQYIRLEEFIEPQGEEECEKDNGQGVVGQAVSIGSEVETVFNTVGVH
jgi:hypothetical protein